MYQAIQTKYAGPTNHRGSRIICRAQAGRKTYGWNHALGITENHTAAAKAYAEHFGWAGKWVGGALADGCGYAFVRIAAHGMTGDSFTVGGENE